MPVFWDGFVTLRNCDDFRSSMIKHPAENTPHPTPYIWGGFKGCVKVAGDRSA